jgi:hypothetical protein
LSGKIARWPNAASFTGTYVGIAIERLSGQFVHAGLIYRVEGGNGAFVLSLGLNGQLTQESPKAGMLCALVNIEPLRAQAIATLARAVYIKNRDTGIPYAFSSPDLDWFAADGRVASDSDKVGLTCSHFLLALFRSARFPLVDLSTWPFRVEDRDWQKNVVEMFVTKRSKKSKHRRHNEALAAGVGSVRCRAPEVAGAAIARTHPCDYRMASRLSRRIELRMPAPPRK